MLSKSLIKFIRSLSLSKYRTKEKIFIIEGDKLVKEALSSLSNPNFKIHSIFALQSWIDKNQKALISFKNLPQVITGRELDQISNLSTPNQVVALLHYDSPELQKLDLEKNLLIALDNIQDPGNLGTIIRLADWYGIKHILLSPGCADPFNPKVCQATMGSVFRIALHRTELDIWLKSLPEGFPVFGAILNGENIYQSKLSSRGVILMGNESRGIKDDLRKMISHPISIPRNNPLEPGPESLNVSVALGIILSEFSRQTS